jgi:serine/threonine protein kinase
VTEPLYDRVVAAIGQQYELEDEIGRGGMSVVYRARDRRLNRQVAVKVLPPELTFDPAIRPRFTREAQTSAHLSHPHIVPIYDVGERDGIAFFVMGFVTGGNLASLLAGEPKQPVEEVRRILAEVASALDYAHVRGVIHRDIKPDNILLDRDSGRAMVTDFGIARAVESGTRLTATGIAVGTPTYMSPEQAVGEREIDGRSDLYSLAVVGYQMLTGRVPFTAGNSLALLLKHVNEAPRPIHELRADAPRPLRDAIERALAKSPEDRWHTAGAMRDALVSNESSVAAWRAGQSEQIRYDAATPSPKPVSRRTRDRGRDDLRVVSPRRGTPMAESSAPLPTPLPVVSEDVKQGNLLIEQGHLVPLTKEQKDDLKLWHGRTTLLERVKSARFYFWQTLVLTVGAGFGFGGFIASEGAAVPLMLSPWIPIYMWPKMFRRLKSLKQHGVKRRRVLFMPRAKWVIPAAPLPAPTHTQQLEKLAPKAVLEGPAGSSIRRAKDDRDAILHILDTIPTEDRVLIPDVAPTVNALMDRVANLAQSLHGLNKNIDTRQLDVLERKIADAERKVQQGGDDRKLKMLEQQRATILDLVDRRDSLGRQLDNAELALGTLRLDLIRLKSSGLQAGLSEVSTATQQARAVSREIGTLLAAVSEARSL